MICPLRYLAALSVVALAAVATPHGVPIQVTTSASGEKLAIAGGIPLAELEHDGFEIATEDPGIGVGFAVSGPPSGTRIGLETIGGLMFWQGELSSPGDAWLTIEAPEFDSLATPNQTAVGEYQVLVSSAAQSGMTWSSYPGASFWDSHGYYLLRSSSGDPDAGVYGVPVRLVDLREESRLDPSDSFVLSFRYDPHGAYADTDVADARAAFAASLATAGDYDGDGLVGVSDYDTWRSRFGNNVTPAGAGADGNANGLVDIADYTVWRDIYRGSQAVSVPEPSCTGSLLIFFLAAARRRNRIRA